MGSPKTVLGGSGLAILLAVLACAPRPVAPTSVASAPDPAGPATPVVEATAPAAAPARSDDARIDDARIDADVATITGGMYSADHIGLEAHAAIEARVAAAPARYARAVARRVEALAGDPHLADLHLASLLGRLYSAAPEETSFAASWVLTQHGMLSASPIADERKQRMAEQRPLLTSLAGGIDRPFSEAWKTVAPERLCSAATPDGHGLRVELGCTCGEVPVCRAELDGTRLHVRVRLDATTPKRCFDCYPGFSTCSLPKLAPGQRLAIDVDGRARGRLVATDSGWLPPDVCVEAR